MSAVLPHYKQGPANYQVASLVFGGQFVSPNNLTPGGTDFTVKLATNAVTVPNDPGSVLGVAGKDAAPITTQTGAANTYGEPLIDISVLDDYTSVWYGGVDIFVWYGPSVNVQPGQFIQIASAFGTVGPAANIASWAVTTPPLIVGRCTVNGGVTAAMCTQQIGGGAGGGGASTYFLGRARVF